MQKQQCTANRTTIADDIAVLREELGFDVITNASRDSSFFMGSWKFEMSKLKFLVDAVPFFRFINADKSNKLMRKVAYDW